MPMDYDDNDFNIHTVHLAGEESSTVSSVLRPYALPKFDYDNSRQGNLRFDSLVENEVFLGITGQEDNQWIEEYSHASSGVEFSSSVAEPRRNNVWSEATSSESVEMLLKSVGREEGVLGDTISEKFDASDEPNSLAAIMDPNLKQDDGSDHVIFAPETMVTNKTRDKFSGSNESNDCEKSHVTSTTQSGEAKISDGELNSVVLGEKCNLYEEKVDRICDVNQEVENVAVELDKYEPQDLSTSIVECVDMGSKQNVDASKGSDFTKNSSRDEAEYSIKNIETSLGNPNTAVETSKYSDEKTSVVSNVESLDNPLFEVSIPVNEESTSLMTKGSCSLLMTEEGKAHVSSAELSHGSKCAGPASPVASEVQELDDSMHGDSLAYSPVTGLVKLQHIEDDNTKSGILASPESNASSPSKVSDLQSRSIEETENTNGSDARHATPDAFEVSAGNEPSVMPQGSSFSDVGANLTNACSSPDLLAGSILNKDLAASINTPKAHSQDMEDKEATELSGSVQVNDGIGSSEQQGLFIDQDVNSNERGDARLSLDRGDMDIEVVGALDSQKNVELTSSAESCEKSFVMTHGSEADMTILAEPVPDVKSSSLDPLDGVHLDSGSVATNYVAAELPIRGVSPVHHDKEQKREAGFLSAGSSENESPKVVSRVDCASEEPLSVVEKDVSPDHVGTIVHGVAGQSVPPVENINDTMSEQAHEATSDSLGCSATLMTSPPRDPSAKVGANVEAGGVQDPKESMSGHYKAAPLSFEVDISTEHHASIDVVLPSECDASHSRHDDDCSVSMDKLRSVYPSDTNNTEPSDSAKVTHEMVKDNALLPQVLEDSLQLVSSNHDTEIDKSLKSEVSASTDLGQTVPAIQACNLLTNMEGSSTIPSSSVSDPKKSDEVTLIIPQTPSTATIQVGAKGNAERKTRRKSVGKVSAKKVKETTPRQSGRVEKSSMLLTPQATGHVIQFDEMKPKEVASSITKPTGIRPLPDLNNATSIFQQPFTDNQQVQLRAQILVYGSLISGTSPEEPHMVAAFGQSDGGRKTWEAAWYACLERVRNNKSQVNNPGTPLQSQADLKDAGTKQSPLPSKVLSSPIGGASNKATPPVVSPLIPLSTPLWNVSTPSSGMPRSALLDYRQSFSPLHPYQTPPVQNLSGHNPPWLSQGPFAGHWLASSPVSTFNAGTCFSALPITEAVKLTPVKLSGSPGIKHTYSIPVVHSAGPSVFSGASPLSDAKNATVSSSQASSDSKGRKRKKAASRVADQTPVPSQALIASVTAPPVAHLPQVPRTDGHSHIPLLVGNPTNLVIAPVVSSIFSTSVTVSAPASKTTRSSPGRFLSISNETLNKAEECKGQAEDVGVAANTSQPSSDSKSIHRKKVTTSLAVDQTSTPRQAPVASITAPVVAYLPHGHSHISLLAQNQTDSATAPVACSSFPTSVGMSRPVSITSKSNPGSFHQIMYSAPRSGYQNTENVVATEEALSKVEQSKLQAENAALLAAAEVSHCQDVWSGLELQRSSGVVSDGEAKLMSSAVSIAAAAAVAKMAAAAAKIASDVAEQARLMADEVLLSSKTENINQSSIMSHPNVIDRYDKATPASIMKGASKSNHPNSIISVAREAARRRIEAASAASKHAENLDAIVKAAELAAEAVSQAGKIVAMGDSSALRELVEAGPEGYWKTSPLAYEVSGHLNSISGKKNSESAPNVYFKEIQTLDRGLVMQQHSVHLAENQVMVDSPNTGIEKEKRIPRAHSGPKLSKAVGVSLEIDAGALHTHIAGQNMPQSVLGAWEQHNIKEGCLVEVYKDDGKYKGAWLAANVLSLKDEKALVCYTEIQSPDEGSEKLKEWVSLEVEGTKVPSIRIAHPMTTMRFEGAKKRRRTAVTDHAWSNGDRVDVWMQDCWRMGVVMEPNKIDVTSLSVQFPGEGETSVVRSWNVRPTLVWKDGKWIEWSSSKGVRASESETPKEKRMKLGNPAKDKSKEKSTNFIDVVEVRRHEETGTLPLSAKESSFNVGKSSRDDNKLNLRTMKSGLQQKEGARVIFGVPKPGKKQKFMDVSKHYVADGSNKNNDPGKFARHLKPQARAWKVNSRENQVAENTSRLKSRKPPVPSFRTLGQKDNNLILGDSEMTDRDRDAVTVNEVENLSSLNHNQIEFGGSSSNSEDATKAYAPKKATPKSNSKHLNKEFLTPADEEAQDKSFSEATEPRRSNRRIQPTSRLLEGLQSSLTISKIPSFSHTSHRSHKVTSKDNVKHG